MSNGELQGPPSKAPVLGKVTLPLGGRLVSQKVPFETDLPTAIHLIGMALIPSDWGWFSRFTPLDPLCSA